MNETIIIRGPVQQAHVIGLIRAIGFEKPHLVTIKTYRKGRSLPQNALMHKWFEIISDETGNTAEEVKEALKEMFLPMVDITIKGVPILVRQRTSGLNTAEMHEFMTKIQAWAATEMDIQLPSPEDAHLR
jgi:hypothetical protein